MAAGRKAVMDFVGEVAGIDFEAEEANVYLVDLRDNQRYRAFISLKKLPAPHIIGEHFRYTFYRDSSRSLSSEITHLARRRLPDEEYLEVAGMMKLD